MEILTVVNKSMIKASIMKRNANKWKGDVLKENSRESNS
jgi:hypothetical protein